VSQIVSYDLWAPATREWVTHRIDLRRKLRDRTPEQYAREWWDEHLRFLAEKGQLRNFTLNGLALGSEVT
jgi:hypothetical protein